MKTGHIVALTILLFSAIGVVPGVAAAATAVPGVQAVVTEDGTSAEVRLTWFLSVDDPNQDIGSLLYNVTVDGGSGWVNLGDASSLTNYVAGGGLQAASVLFGGAPGSNTFNITVDDGTGPVDSCTVTVDTSVDGDYALCGSMSFAWNQIHCLSRTGEETTGFDTDARIFYSAADDELKFDYAPGSPAHGGKTLGGDTGSYEFEFTMRAGVDGSRSRVVGLFSSVDTPVVKGGGGNFQTTGAFRDGISFRLTETGSTWELEMYEHINGGRTAILETVITGEDPNAFTGGKFTVNQFSGIVQLTLGSSTYAISESDMTGSLPANLYSFWLAGDAVSFLAGPDTYFKRDGNSLCFNTLDNNFGGGSADFIGEGQAIETFPGAGGVGGNPMFPGLDVAGQAEKFGMESSIFALLLAGILFLGLTILGLAIGGPGGAILGALSATALSVIFNLIPYWFLVVAFLLAVTIIILGRRQ